MIEDQDIGHIKYKLNKRIYTLLDVFKNKSIRNPTIILCFIHFFIELFYWGTGFALPSLGTSIYLNMLLFGAVEILSYIIAGLT